jgi:hypothetical protein
MLMDSKERNFAHFTRPPRVVFDGAERDTAISAATIVSALYPRLKYSPRR